MKFYDQDNALTVKEIDEFIKKIDSDGFFSTREKWRANFMNHCKQVIEAGQIVTFRDKSGKLAGLCSWAVIDNRRKQQINKSRWLLPKDISSGYILYIDMCLLGPGTSIFKIKKYLEDRYDGKGIISVFWFDLPNSRVFRAKFKGGSQCPEELIAV